MNQRRCIRYAGDNRATVVGDTSRYAMDAARPGTLTRSVGGSASGRIHEVRDGDSIQAAVAAAGEGDIIRVFPGTYSETVYIDKDDLVISGVVIEGAWPVMDGNKELNDAILYSGNDITVENLQIQHYKGNAIMGQAGNNFLIRNNNIIDTGVYGIFPEFGTNGLITHNVLSGIEDAAIYVGMSDNIHVTTNEVFGNVAGIEIENTRHSIVENNYVHDNTGGILVFITPGLPIKTTFDTIVRNNFIVNNNTPNFGIPGSTVAGIPAGTGILNMAGDQTTIEGNVITGNKTIGILITDHHNAPNVTLDPGADPNSDEIAILDNLMWNNGYDTIPEVKALKDGVVGRLQQHAERQPRYLRKWLEVIDWQVSRTLGDRALSFLNAEWRSSVWDDYQRGLRGRYPLSSASERDTTLGDFGDFFGPGGSIERFFDEYLRDLIDTSGRVWRLPPNSPIHLSRESLQALQRARVIQDAFFASQDRIPLVRFNLKPISMDVSIDDFFLDLDGQILRYDHSATKVKKLQWPGSQATGEVILRLSPPSAGGSSGVTIDGPWAWFRLLDRSTLTPMGSADRFEVTFDVDGRKVYYELRAASSRNPFRLGELKRFQCPEIL